MAETPSGNLIYILEDDTDIREIEIYTLRSQGFVCEGFTKAADFFLSLERRVPDLLVLDIMLPDADGCTVLSRLRNSEKTRQLPILMATARGAEFERIRALNLGADDYLVKPFSMLEMAARIKAILRRTHLGNSEVLTFGEITLDSTKHEARVSGRLLDLSKKEFELLEIFLTHPGRVYSRETLLDLIWDDAHDTTSRTVDVHVGTLRAKLRDAANCIHTVHGVGYKLQP